MSMPISETITVAARFPTPGMELSSSMAARKGSTVVRHADGQLRRAAFPRLTFSKMSLAFAVQMNGLG